VGPALYAGEDTPRKQLPQDTVETRWVVSSEGTEARYRVREQLAGFDFPNDAVGATGGVSGSIVIAADGSVVSDQSEFRVQLASLTTDNQRRDGYVRSRTLEVEQYPEAILVPTRFLGLETIPESGSATFQLEGELTLHGVTKSTVWEVMANFGEDSISGLATIAFPFDTFGISVPRVARVLSVDDNIRLELQFRLTPERD
jgi:polyisoprenoid-binding protein YceI